MMTVSMIIIKLNPLGGGGLTVTTLRGGWQKEDRGTVVPRLKFPRWGNRT